MVGWLATQYQCLAAKAERDGQYSAAVGALNALRAMVVQPQQDAQFAAHFRGRFTHQGHRRLQLSSMTSLLTMRALLKKVNKRYQRAQAVTVEHKPQ